MKIRTILFLGAIALAVAGLAVEQAHRLDVVSATSGPLVIDTAPEPRPEPAVQDFAVLELAVDATPVEFIPYVFILEFADPSGATRRVELEASQNGVALFGPLTPGAEVRVSVVAGGEAFGYDGAGDAIGEAKTTIEARGGRQFLVVPTRAPHVTATNHRILVLDGDGWPVEGARIALEGNADVLETNAHGFCAADRAARIVGASVTPPPGRPELDPVRRKEDLALPSASFTLSRRQRDVTVGELTSDCLGGPVDRLCLVSADGRAWVRRWNVASGARLEQVPFGRYVMSWTYNGARREGLLSVTAESVEFRLTSESAPAASVLVTRIGDPSADDMTDGLVLVERSERNSALPTFVVATEAYESMAGCGVTNWFTTALADQNGTPEFTFVPPGTYEIRSRRSPRAVSHCVRVPQGSNGPIHVAAEFRPRDGRIVGTLRGRAQEKTWTVEVRVVGEFSETRTLHVGETFEFSGLAPGIYSVWATREDWGSQPLRGEPLPMSPWRNVRIDPGRRVTLDFEIE